MISRTAASKGWAQICVGDRSLARDPAFADAFADSSAAIAEAGLDTAGGRDARRRYVEEQLAGGFGASHSGRMMASFMLGRWLRRTDAVSGRPDHRSLMSSLMVIIPHGLSELVTKGEVVERYYNPGELFSRVDIVMTAEDRPDPAQVAPMVGDAELHLHSVPIPDGLFRRTLGFRPERVAGWVDQIVQIARRVRPALVRCHGAHLNALAARRIRDELGTPYAVSVHINPDVRGRASTVGDRLRLRAMVPMERAGLQGADIVLPVYESILPYPRRMNVTRFEVAYNVVGGRHLRQKNDYALHRPVRVVSVGRLFTLKNPENLIRAVNDLVEVDLTVVGDGPLRSRLQQIACDRVRFEPTIPNAALCALLAEQDIFATHSQHWEISKTVLEAFLTGLQVVWKTAASVSPSPSPGALSVRG